ncbi:MAG TPA: LacI family DNA-binding transcriptional regulator [Phnomibacter sp.]|nr:LacI family DNA-binding transcriptional regulator [Phnomibacter sp.]
MNKQKDITIYDIAEILGISIATVSRALNDDEKVSKKTKKSVADLAAKLGYRHNNFASNLRKQKTNTIGVIVPRLNSFFIKDVLTGIEKVATAAGYDILIANSSETIAKESSNANSLFHKRMDGVIASLSIETTNLKHFEPYAEKGIPVVLFDRVCNDIEFPRVIIDNTRCGYMATEHLIEQGCKRIAFITGNLSSSVYAQRLEGYKNALRDHKLPVSDSLIFITDLSEESGVMTAHKLLHMRNRPDGVFVSNDFVATVCMHELKSKGIRIPEDMAFVGFNNDTVSRLIEPPLSTIHYPGLEMGEIAARQLMGMLNGTANMQQTNTIILRSDLLVRASSLRKK